MVVKGTRVPLNQQVFAVASTWHGCPSLRLSSSLPSLLTATPSVALPIVSAVGGSVAMLSDYWDPAQWRVGLVVLKPFHIYIITQGVIRYVFVPSYTKLIKAGLE